MIKAFVLFSVVSGFGLFAGFGWLARVLFNY